MKHQKFARRIRFLKARVNLLKDSIKEDEEELNILKERIEAISAELFKLSQYPIDLSELIRIREHIAQRLGILSFDIRTNENLLVRLRREINYIPLG